MFALQRPVRTIHRHQKERYPLIIIALLTLMARQKKQTREHRVGILVDLTKYRFDLSAQLPSLEIVEATIKRLPLQ